jgi:hypothetical protein
MLYSDFEEISNKYYFSNMFSPEPLGKWQYFISETSEKSKNQSTGSHFDLELFTFCQTFYFYFMTQSL